MQNIGYIIDKRTNEKIKVLWRYTSGSTYVSFKLRKTGTDGNHLIDEEIFLNENPDFLDRLKAGEVIHL